MYAVLAYECTDMVDCPAVLIVPTLEAARAELERWRTNYPPEVAVEAMGADAYTGRLEGYAERDTNNWCAIHGSAPAANGWFPALISTVPAATPA